ncbi:MAG: trypsin-like peptidase domain-containing protein [Oscillospiraceae bacterium]|nr:trypsin-like peptidase domain-containing protein [Oscillospiraceae bacterium]
MGSNNFKRSVLIPFLSGIIGAVVVLAVYLNIPGLNKNIASINNPIDTNNALAITTSSVADNQTNYTAVSDLDIGSVVAQKILPSVVGITVEYQVSSFFRSGMTTTATASGSGIILTSNGYILTNNHVIDTSSSSNFYQVSEASKISVYLYNDSTPYDATIVGADTTADLAILKIDKTGLTPAEIGNSDNLKIGQFAMAVGNPLGFSSSVSTGSISALNRKVDDSPETQDNLIQTDAAINSGNSGGALVNSQGQVIGVNCMKVSSVGVEGISFAIPINTCMDFYNNLMKNPSSTNNTNTTNTTK